jgi:hypothetical protein
LPALGFTSLTKRRPAESSSKLDDFFQIMQMFN